MIELVAAYGYEDLTVRGLAKRARISSGTFYDHYRGTDDCLLSTFDLICRRTAQRLVEAGRSGEGPQRHLELAVVCLFEDMAAFPEIVTFMLRAAPAAGPAFASGLRNSATRLGAALEFCVDTDGNGSLHPLLLEGMVAGLARIGRVFLPPVGDGEIEEVAAEAVEWIRSVSAFSVRDVEASIAPDPPMRAKSRSMSPDAAPSGEWESARGDERAMILAAAFSAARGGYHQLSIRGICSEAGVSRRNFNRHFKDLEHCYIAALEDRATRAITAAFQRRDAASWTDTIHEAVATLCNSIEDDRDGARALFVEITAAGTRGIASRDRLISRVARTLRTTAPEGRGPSEFAAEASAAAAWTVLRRRVQDQSAATNAALPVLSHLILAPIPNPTHAKHTAR